MSVFRPLLIGNYSENGTVHNSCFLITFPVSLGLYYRGRRFAVAVEVVWGWLLGGGNKNRVSANSLRTDYLADPHIFTLRTVKTKILAPEPLFDSAQPLFSRAFYVLDPEGGGTPPGRSKKGWDSRKEWAEQCRNRVGVTLWRAKKESGGRVADHQTSNHDKFNR